MRDPSYYKSEEYLIERQLMAIKARGSLITYTRFVNPAPEDPNALDMSAYHDAKFHRQIAEVLEQVAAAKHTQVILCMPPRHGKTKLATESFAGWYSGLHPDHDVAVAMATDLLATDIGSNVRNTMLTPGYQQVFPKHKLISGGRAKDNIQTTKKGRLVFVGRGGTLNGRGAHLLLVDDLYKDALEAQSQTIRDQAWDWFIKVALFRRMGEKLTILTMTRWHSDDIIGRLTDPNNPHYNAEEAAEWKIIRLPGLAEENDALGRKPGEALWPDETDETGKVTVKRFSRKYLLSAQRKDPLGFAALVQQTPTLQDGDLFRKDDIRYYTPSELPDDLRIYCSSDHAVALGQRNDPSCLLKIGIDSRDDIYILNCIWRKMPSDQAVEAMLAMASGNQRPLIWWAEKDKITKAIGPFLRKRMAETRTYINIKEVNPATDKTQRAQSIAGRVAMRKVFFPKEELWVQNAVNEMLAFPNGTHDDFVDALAYIGMGLNFTFAASRAIETHEPAVGSFAWVKLQEKLDREDAKKKELEGAW